MFCLALFAAACGGSDDGGIEAVSDVEQEVPAVSTTLATGTTNAPADTTLTGPETSPVVAGDVGAPLLAAAEGVDNLAILADLAPIDIDLRLVEPDESVVVLMGTDLPRRTEEMLVSDGTRITVSDVTGGVIVPVTVSGGMVGHVVIRDTQLVLEVDVDADGYVDVIDTLTDNESGGHDRTTVATQPAGDPFIEAHRSGDLAGAWCSVKVGPVEETLYAIEMCPDGDNQQGSQTDETLPFEVVFNRLSQQYIAESEDATPAVGSTALAGGLFPGSDGLIDGVLDDWDRSFRKDFPDAKGPSNKKIFGVLGIMFEVLEYGNVAESMPCERVTASTPGADPCNDPLWNATPVDQENCDAELMICGATAETCVWLIVGSAGGPLTLEVPGSGDPCGWTQDYGACLEFFDPAKSVCVEFEIPEPDWEPQSPALPTFPHDWSWDEAETLAACPVCRSR